MIYLPKKPSQLLKVLLECLAIMEKQEGWKFNPNIFTTQVIWVLGKPSRHYGVLGAVGIALLEKPYRFMPEDFDNKNRPRLWALHFLSQGWTRLALMELKIKPKTNEMKRFIPDVKEGYDEYKEALERYMNQLKKEGL